MEVDPGAPVERWGVTVDSWYCRIGYDGRLVVRAFYTGTGLRPNAPTVNEVLSCMFADAAMYEELGNDPDAWADELGGVQGSIKEHLNMIAEARTETESLKLLFGPDYDEACLVDWEKR